tara:strand:+ start:1167 stop:3695 length:2529 start_codon:yes stop_codon:yes gene_type:complete
MAQERIIICALDHAYGTDNDNGKARALFEQIDDEIHPINQKEIFCETSNVFIMRGYDDIKEKYGDGLFLLKCSLTRNNIKEGDCKYVSAFEHASPIRSKFCVAEVFNEKVPDLSTSYVITDKKPSTQMIFLRHLDKLQGPFLVSKVEESNSSTFKTTIDTQSIDYRSEDKESYLPAYHYAELKISDASNQIVNFRYGVNNLEYTCDVKRLLNNTNKTVDYMSDDQVLSKYGQMLVSNSQIRNFTKGMLPLIKNQVSQSKEYRANKIRFERFFDLLAIPGDDGEWGRIRRSLMDEFIKSEKGKDILISFVESNKEDYFRDEKIKFTEEIKNQTSELRSEISTLEQSKLSIESDIRQKRKEFQNIESDDYKAQLAEEANSIINKDIENKRKEFAELSEKFEKIQKKYNHFSSVEEAEAKKINLDAYKDILKGDIAKLEKQNEQLKSDVNQSNQFYVDKLLSVKNEVDVLTGSNTPKEVEATNYSVPAKLDVKSAGENAQVGYINRISETLSDIGRKTDFNQLANIVVTIAQSQFTLFSGYPGTGKTSLAKLLGQSMGLGNRLLNIPVARGWTSSRDVLGFYNALSQSFVPSATGFYHLLEQMQDELTEKNSSPAIILLDEFNLSQPEHYFSPFLEMADVESNRKIFTGDPNKAELSVPIHMRFLGTVNHDDSVQILTPRMLDRASIIHFDDIVQDGSIVGNLNTIDKIDASSIISGPQFTELFAATRHTLPDNIQNIIDNIISVLHDDDPKLGNQVIVSFRKRKAISAYHNVASTLLIDRNLYALDYAVCQHIVPLLSGYGENFGLRLSKLFEIMPDEMEMSRKRISRIMTKGELNLFSYGAFA